VLECLARVRYERKAQENGLEIGPSPLETLVRMPRNLVAHL